MVSEQAPPARTKRVLWLTNLAAPYRVPVWEELSRHFRLDVGLLESNDSLLNDAKSNRGRDWLHGEARGFTYIEIPTWKWRKGESKYFLLRGPGTLMRLREYDVVLFGGWESPAYWVLLVFSRLFRLRCVAFYESTKDTMKHRQGPIAWIRSRFFRSMSALVTPGPAATAALLSMGVPRINIHEGFNAVQVEAFHHAAKREEMKASHGHGFLYVGQLIERKRVNAIIDAFTLVSSPGDWLTVVGSGPLQAQLASQAAETGAQIDFVSQINNSEMPALMAKHHTLVLASLKEVWGLVVNEALATGLHTVVPRNCGVAPSVEHMDGVFLVEPDLRDLVQKMEESSASWRGRVPHPSILQHTPAEFAQVFGQALSGETETLVSPK